MGSVEVVPGVSSATIALVLGIYERLVHTVHLGANAAGCVLRGDLRGARAGLARIEWGFILPLLVGIVATVLALAGLIEHLLQEYPESMAGLFCGLIGASVWVAKGYLKRPERRLIGPVVFGAVATFLVLGLRSDDVSDPALWVVFGAGALAACAMILPGISGSFVLLMVGMYEYMLAALNGRDVVVAGIFIGGALLGLALFSSVMDRLLAEHHDLVLALLIGAMIGSLRVLWPWPGGVESAALGAPASDGWLIPTLLAVGAATVVLVVGRRAGRAPAAESAGPSH